MLEYLVLFSTKDSGHVHFMLNTYAKEGWRLVCCNNEYIFMEREVEPRVEVIDTKEGGKQVTYSWPPVSYNKTSEEPSD